MPPNNKKPAAKVATGHMALAGRRSFSDLFNVAASRPAKSPRDKNALDPSAGLRQSGHSLNHLSSAAWPGSRHTDGDAPLAPDRHPSRQRYRGAVPAPARWRRRGRSMPTRSSRQASTSGSGEKAWRVRASFLPGPAHTVTDKLDRLKLHEIDLGRRRGAGDRLRLHRAAAGKPDLPPAHLGLGQSEELDRPSRHLHPRHDRPRPGVRQDPRRAIRGPLYLEVSPRTFPIVARTGSRLSQIRFRTGHALLSEGELAALHRAETLVATEPPNISGGGIALSIDLDGDERQPDRLSRQAPHRPRRRRQARRA